MAGDEYLGTGPQGAIFRRPDGSVGPAPRPRKTPTNTIVNQLSSESRSTLSARLSGAFTGTASRVMQGARGPTYADRAAGMVRGVSGFVNDANQMIEGGIRANPYGGFIGDDERTKRRTGFEGYFGESEFAAPNGEARFYPGDARKILDNMDGAVVSRLQLRLEKLGFLTGTWAPGAVLPNTVSAFEDLLSESNRRGMTWGSTLGELEQLYEELGIDLEESEGPAPFVPDPYLAPDYATMAQGIKNQMRQALGRDPDDSEIAQLTAELDGWYRSAYDEEVEAARRKYELEAAGEGGTPEAGRRIDPEARFKEMFESRYAPGIKNEEMKEQTARIQGTTQGNIGAMSDMMRGGAG